jgi:hypothetical protein
MQIPELTQSNLIILITRLEELKNTLCLVINY